MDGSRALSVGHDVHSVRGRMDIHLVLVRGGG